MQPFSGTLRWGVCGLAAVVCFWCGQARADVVSLTGTSTVTGGTAYNYSLSIASGEQINPGDFFRVYDFGSFNGVVATPAGFTFSSALTNPTPPPNVILSHGDDATIPNLTWTYTGTTPIVGPTIVTGFSADSTSSQTTVKDFASRFTESTGQTAGAPVDSVGSISVPAPVPEPATVGLLAAGTIGLLARRRR